MLGLSRHPQLRAEALDLDHGALGRLRSGNAGGKAEVVLDPRRSRRLPAFATPSIAIVSSPSGVPYTAAARPAVPAPGVGREAGPMIRSRRRGRSDSDRPMSLARRI